MATPPAIKPIAEGDQDVDFDAELAALESGDEPSAPVQKGKKTPEEERKQAEFTLTSTAKRLKELGGDPSAVIGADTTPAAAPSMDTSRFVTKEDIARGEAGRLARSPGEAKLIMWYVTNKGLSVEQAHLLANQGRVKTALSEITRSRSAIPSKGGGGPGAPASIDDASTPELPASSLARVKAAGMIWNAEKKAYVGKKSMLQYDRGQKAWVTSLIQQPK